MIAESRQQGFFWRNEVGFVLSMFMGLFSAIALFSFHPADPSFYQYSQGFDVYNWEGFLGAHLAGLLIFLLGYCAYAVPLLFVYLAYTCVTNRSILDKTSVAGGSALMLGLLGLFSLHAPQEPIFPVGCGGWLGDVLSWQLTAWSDVVGATILFSGIILVGLTLFLEIPWFSVLSLSRLNLKRPTKPGLFIGSSSRRKEKITDRKSSLSKKSSAPVELSVDLLRETKAMSPTVGQEEKQIKFADEIEQRLNDFGIETRVVAVLVGPVITRYELTLAAGTKVSRITALGKDLARSLSVSSVRIVEVIPGKSVIGLEFPNEVRQTVALKEILESPEFKKSKSPLTLALGKDISGVASCADLAKMPHLLVAGTTGAGKSVGLNAMLLSMLYKASPEELRLILIDPKMLELSAYSDIPHLLTPVVTNMEDAAGTLRWCVAEMERRYQLMAAVGVRNIAGYNEKLRKKNKSRNLLDEALIKANQEGDAQLEPLPYIVVVADEFADMIMVVGKKVEQLIARLAQKARAAGIHLILATQRPSVDVITGLIKANIPCRISFQVSSKIDSRTILDQQGAEQLLGFGDMLYLPSGAGVPTRVHGAYVSDDEVHQVVREIKKSGKPVYVTDVTSHSEPVQGNLDGLAEQEQDPLYKEAVESVIKAKKVSVSSVQRRFRIGYNRAANLVEAMEQNGVVSTPEHNGQRQVLLEDMPASDS